MHGEVFIHTAKPSDKVIFEGPNGAFSGIAAMNAGRNELEVHSVGMHEVFEESRTFVVKALQAWFQASGAEPFVQISIGRDDGGGLTVF
jgi:hypothetical protein